MKAFVHRGSKSTPRNYGKSEGRRWRLRKSKTPIAKRMDGAQLGPYLDVSQTAIYLHVGSRTLARWRGTGMGPVFIKAGHRVLYARDELDRWTATNKFKSTSEVRSLRNVRGVP